MIEFPVSVVGESGTIRRATLIADDWDAALVDLEELEKSLHEGEWISCDVLRSLLPKEILQRLP